MHYRHPHKEIIGFLGNCEFDGDSTPLNPLTARAFVDCASLGCTQEQFEEAIEDLNQAGIVVSRSHALTGEELIGLRDMVASAEAARAKAAGG